MFDFITKIFRKSPESDSSPEEMPTQSAPLKESIIGLQEIVGCDNASRKLNVIFVHGLGGNVRSTWQPEGVQSNDYWLYWLSQKINDIGIWSYGYEAEPSKWKGYTMPLFDQASILLEFIQTKKIDEKPLVFVAHSLGGLLVKNMLQRAQTFKKEKLIAQIKGIVFLATPHTGSNLANLIKNFSILARTTISVQELEAHAPELRRLNEWYRENVRELDINSKVYYETKPIYNILIVDEDSANPEIEGVLPVATPEDHITIAKPISKNAIVYCGVKNFIEECCQQAQKRWYPDDLGEELTEVLDTLTSTKQSRKQKLTRSDLFCSMVRSRIHNVDSNIQPRVFAMLDDFDQRLNATTSIGQFQVTDSVKDLLSKSSAHAKKNDVDMGVRQLMEVLLEDPGDNIERVLDKHGFTTRVILNQIEFRSAPIFSDAS